MKIIEMSTSKLVPYANNPRNNEAAVDVVAASIEKFGFKVPLVIDRDNVIVTGHTRLLAAQKLGIKKVPCIVADDLTEEQIRAFRLADNKVAEASSWDWGKLDEELAALKDIGADIDMSEFGFDMPDLSDDDLDKFFEKDETPSEKKKETKTVICPGCGEAFEVEL